MSERHAKLYEASPKKKKSLKLTKSHIIHHN